MNKKNKEVVSLILAVLLITVSTTFISDVLREVIDLNEHIKSNQSGNSDWVWVLFTIFILMLWAGIHFGRLIADKLSEPDNRSFKEICDQRQKQEYIRAATIIITSISPLKCNRKPLKVQSIKEYLSVLFDEYTIKQIKETKQDDLHDKELCDKLKDVPGFDNLDKIELGFPWQQQLRLLLEFKKLNPSIRLNLALTKEAAAQIDAFKFFIEKINEKANMNIRLIKLGEELDFTQIDQVSNSLNARIDYFLQEFMGNVILDVTAGFKTYSMAATLATVDKEHAITTYVDMAKPFALRMQNIKNNKASELHVT